MSKTIRGVMDSITREAYVSLIHAVGLDPHLLTDLSFHANGIKATVFAIDESGAKVIDPVEGVAVKHSIYIPVKDEA